MIYPLILTNFIVPKPIPSYLNLNLRSATALCYGHLFYFNPHSEANLENVSHLTSFRSAFRLLQDLIKSTLAAKNLGVYGISAGILEPNVSFPNLEPLHKKLASFRAGKNMMIIIVSSYEDCMIIQSNVLHY